MNWKILNHFKGFWSIFTHFFNHENVFINIDISIYSPIELRTITNDTSRVEGILIISEEKLITVSMKNLVKTVSNDYFVALLHYAIYQGGLLCEDSFELRMYEKLFLNINFLNHIQIFSSPFWRYNVICLNNNWTTI